MSLIISHIPGRIRLRHADLRLPQRLDRLQAMVVTWRHVRATRANPDAGSLVVNYDANELDGARLAKRLETAAQRVISTPLPRPGKGAGTTRVRVNRWAKRGMLSSLAISLLLAGAGRKRWHALSGGMFVASLAIHLWVHRRHVLR